MICKPEPEWVEQLCSHTQEVIEYLRVQNAVNSIKLLADETVNVACYKCKKFTPFYYQHQGRG